ncbi:hypothetical protein GJ688_01875 [Heliobacillus mobilis]|uniref:Uncharacterized protein n=1 Tax=Heliobacterium mobile TaxID=28064 RepID=A0A6I3SFC1_HELMO|nr:hypothetical protein [Heliobacterium mobile]MTV47730.1 hypothetical protein [Heliobacterium mobile]
MKTSKAQVICQNCGKLRTVVGDKKPEKQFLLEAQKTECGHCGQLIGGQKKAG